MYNPGYNGGQQRGGYQGGQNRGGMNRGGRGGYQNNNRGGRGGMGGSQGGYQGGRPMGQQFNGQQMMPTQVPNIPLAQVELQQLTD
jgi:hypothetical protein